MPVKFAPVTLALYQLMPVRLALVKLSPGTCAFAKIRFAMFLPDKACAMLSNAVAQFEVVLSDPAGITEGMIAGMQTKIRDLTNLAREGERITSSWIEAIAPASLMPHNGGIDIYG